MALFFSLCELEHSHCELEEPFLGLLIKAGEASYMPCYSFGVSIFLKRFFFAIFLFSFLLLLPPGFLFVTTRHVREDLLLLH